MCPHPEYPAQINLPSNNIRKNPGDSRTLHPHFSSSTCFGSSGYVQYPPQQCTPAVCLTLLKVQRRDQVHAIPLTRGVAHPAWGGRMQLLCVRSVGTLSVQDRFCGVLIERRGQIKTCSWNHIFVNTTDQTRKNPEKLLVVFFTPILQAQNVPAKSRSIL